MSSYNFIKLPNHSRLLELFEFIDGELIRKIRTSNNSKVGDIVGSLKSNGYKEVSVDNQTYYLHRLIWKWVTGEEPLDELDHINGNKSDNGFENLRLSNRCDNNSNRHQPAHSKIGIKGVYKNEYGNFKVKFSINRKSKNYGTYKTLEEATEISRAACKELGRHFIGEAA